MTTSQEIFANQNVHGLRPVISWTCLAFVTLSVSGKMRKTETRIPIPRGRATPNAKTNGERKALCPLVSTSKRHCQVQEK